MTCCRALTCVCARRKYEEFKKRVACVISVLLLVQAAGAQHGVHSTAQLVQQCTRAQQAAGARGAENGQRGYIYSGGLVIRKRRAAPPSASPPPLSPSLRLRDIGHAPVCRPPAHSTARRCSFFI